MFINETYIIKTYWVWVCVAIYPWTGFPALTFVHDLVHIKNLTPKPLPPKFIVHTYTGSKPNTQMYIKLD